MLHIELQVHDGGYAVSNEELADIVTISHRLGTQRQISPRTCFRKNDSKAATTIVRKLVHLATRSEGIPGRLRREFDVAEVRAKPQTNA